MRSFWVYIVASPKRTIYTGMTNNLQRRLWEHRNGFGGDWAFAHQHGCTSLVFIEEHGGPRDAIAREKQIKGWSRPKKIALIESINPEWADLSADWLDEVDPAHEFVR